MGQESETLMAIKKKAAEETTREIVVMDEKTKLVPAALVGASINIPVTSLPEGFGDVELETLNSGFNPSPRWTEYGQFVTGVYEGKEEGVGPNESNLYNFDAKGKKFSVWGNTTLDRVFASGVIQPGDLLLITYAGEIDTDKGNPCKLFDVKKAKVKKA